jgi:hypothetical protein
MVETDINMDIDWIFLKEPTCFDIITAIYPHATVVMWKEGVVLPKGTVLMHSQWIPPKTHAIWKRPELKLVLAQVAIHRCKSCLGWKSFPSAPYRRGRDNHTKMLVGCIGMHLVSINMLVHFCVGMVTLVTRLCVLRPK